MEEGEEEGTRIEKRKGRQSREGERVEGEGKERERESREGEMGSDREGCAVGAGGKEEGKKADLAGERLTARGAAEYEGGCWHGGSGFRCVSTRVQRC